MIKKNHFILTLIVIMVPFFCFTQEEESLKIIHGPYLQNVTESGATILFSTNKLVVPGVLIRSGKDDFELVQNSHDGLIDVGDNLHKVRIENLQPGESFDYRLYACEILNYRPYEVTYGDTIISQTYSFKTFYPDKKKINFTVFCDLHDKPGKLIKYLESNTVDQQDCYFFNGDIMGHLEEDEQLFHSFIDPSVETFASKIPFFYVRGNHETRGQFARELKDYLDLSDDVYYYAQTIGTIRFIVLDGGEDKPDSTKAYSGLVDFDYYRLEELKWLKKELKSDEFKTATHKVVIIHMPVLKSERNWYGMAFLAEHFGPVLQEAGIDLMISGHTHRNAWIQADKSGFGYPIIISSNNHFVEAEAGADGIFLKLKDLDGKVVSEYDLKND